MEDTKEQQELMFKLSLFEQQIRAVQEQMQAVEQALVESTQLKLGLDELKKSKNKEVFSSIGKGIFIKSKITDEELLVDVGGKRFVRKSISETQKIIEDQEKKLSDVQKDLEDKLEEINNELTKTYMTAQEKGRTN